MTVRPLAGEPIRLKLVLAWRRDRVNWSHAELLHQTTTSAYEPTPSLPPPSGSAGSTAPLLAAELDPEAQVDHQAALDAYETAGRAVARIEAVSWIDGGKDRR